MRDGQAKTLIERVEWHAKKAEGRFTGPGEESNPERWRLAVGPLVAANMDLEDKLAAALSAGSVAACEIERLRSEVEHERRARVELRDVLTAAQAGMSKETKRADDADDEIERLTTTSDVLAGRLAARGQS